MGQENSSHPQVRSTWPKHFLAMKGGGRRKEERKRKERRENVGPHVFLDGWSPLKNSTSQLIRIDVFSKVSSDINRCHINGSDRSRIVDQSGGIIFMWILDTYPYFGSRPRSDGGDCPSKACTWVRPCQDGWSCSPSITITVHPRNNVHTRYSISI